MIFQPPIIFYLQMLKIIDTETLFITLIIGLSASFEKVETPKDITSYAIHLKLCQNLT